MGLCSQVGQKLWVTRDLLLGVGTRSGSSPLGTELSNCGVRHYLQADGVRIKL